MQSEATVSSSPPSAKEYGEKDRLNEIETAAVNQTLPCLQFSNNVCIVTTTQRCAKGRSLLQHRDVFHSGCDAFEFKVANHQECLNLSNWSLPNFRDRSEGSECGSTSACATTLETLSGQPLNILNLVLAIYEKYSPDFLRTIKPQDKMKINKLFLPLKNLSQLRDGVCGPQVALNLADLIDVVMSEIRECEELIVDTNYGSADSDKMLSFGQNRTKNIQGVASSTASVYVTYAVDSPAESLPAIHLRIPVMINLFSKSLDVS